jgi:hypothetical protein
MIIYLDQNKWIELARMVNRLDNSDRAKRVVSGFDAAIERDVKIPLSSVHYIETARISRADRKSRLGNVMFDYSKGTTFTDYPTIVKHELEVALAKHFPQITPGDLILVGRGVSHAFGASPLKNISKNFEEQFERMILVGEANLNIEPPSFRNNIHQEQFKNHLATIRTRKNDLPKKK